MSEEVVSESLVRTWAIATDYRTALYVPPGFEFVGVENFNTLSTSFDLLWQPTIAGGVLDLFHDQDQEPYDPLDPVLSHETWQYADKYFISVGGVEKSLGATLIDFENRIWLTPMGRTVVFVLMTGGPEDWNFTEPPPNPQYVPLG